MFTQLHNGGVGRMLLGCSTKNYLVSCEWLYTHMAWQRKVDSSSRSCLTHWASTDTNHVILTWCCLLHKYITSASMSLSEICCHIWSWVKMFLSGFTSDCYWAITNQQALYVVNEQNWLHIKYTDTFVGLSIDEARQCLSYAATIWMFMSFLNGLLGYLPCPSMGVPPAPPRYVTRSVMYYVLFMCTCIPFNHLTSLNCNS